MLRWQGTALAAGLLLLAGGPQVRADNDVIRLGGADVGAQTQTLGFDGQVTTQDVRWGRGYCGRSYYGGYGGGYGYSSYYGGWGRGYYGGGYYGGGYPSYYGGGYYRPYASYYRPYYGGYYGSGYPSYYGSGYGGGYYGGGYGGGYYGGGYPSYYGGYYPSYAYYGGYRCADSTPAMPPATVLGSSSYSIPAPRVAVPLTPGVQPSTQPLPNGNGDGTFPYNGGPSTVPPLPSDNAPAVQPPPATVPREGKLVSAPSSAPPAYFYRAYGTSSSSPPAVPVATPAPPRVTTNASTPTTTVRVIYPAYGQ